MTELRTGTLKKVFAKGGRLAAINWMSYNIANIEENNFAGCQLTRNSNGTYTATVFEVLAA